MNLLYLSAFPVVCDNGDLNDNTAAIPQIWAFETLRLLDETSVMANLVHRDFENDLREFGDTVNTRRPRKMTTTRKTDVDDVEEEDAILDKVRVVLDQHIYKSFIIKNGELSLSRDNLIATHFVPAANSVSRGIDRAVMGQVHQFFGAPADRVGKLGGLSPSTARDYVVDARTKLELNNVPEDIKWRLAMSTLSKGEFLKTNLFTQVDMSGTSSALRSAMLGDLFGFDTYGIRNVPHITDVATDVASGTVTAAIAADVAPAAQAVSIIGYNANVGEFAVVAGNQQPQYLTAVVLTGADTTSVTLNEAHKFDSSAGAAIKVYKACASTAAYAAGYSKNIVVDGFTNPPQVGQLLASGSGASRKVYTIIESSSTGVVGERALLLDRPLENAIANNELLFPGPAGAFNFAFHRDALALVTRPMALPPQNLGAFSALAVNGGMGVSVVMQYDSKKQGTRVNIDMLAGVALLDRLMGVPILG